MVSYQKSLIILLSLFVLMIGVVYATDTKEYDQCLTMFTHDDCYNKYCTQNRDAVSCVYPDEIRRLATSELYPVSCGQYDFEWNTSESVRWFFALNLDAKYYKENDYACKSYNKPFPAFSMAYRYDVPYRFLSFVELYKNMYVDDFGVAYVVKPTKGELRKIYPELRSAEVNTMFDNLQPQAMIPNQFTILSCDFDCDYTGTNDNDANNGYSAFDYTYATKFHTRNAGTKWSEVISDQLDTQCSGSMFDFLGAFRCFFTNTQLLTNNFWEWWTGDTNYVFDRSTGEYDYTFYYSKKTNVAEPLECKYPKSLYANKNVTVRATCTLGKSWESIMYNPDVIADIEWDKLGFNNCPDGSPGCEIEMKTKMYLNGTSGQLQYVNSSVSDMNSSWQDIVNRRVNDIPYYGTEPINDDTQDSEPTYALFQRDIQRDKAIVRTIEFSEYIFSAIILVSYFVQLTLLIGAFVIIISSFKAVIGAFKRIFDFNIKGERR